MKSKRKKLTGCAVALAATVIVGACSPIDPSVSKFAGSSATTSSLKLNANDPNSGLNLSGIAGTAANLSARSMTAANGAVQVTQLQTFAQFHGSWDLVQKAKSAFELDANAIAQFKANGLADFATETDHLKGQEDELATSKTVISLVFNTDAATVSAFGLSDMQTSLKWSDATSTTPAHWELAIVAPNTGDPVKDMNTYKQYLSAFQENLVDVTLEFQTD